MDRLAAALGLDPLEVRRRNALPDGGTLPTGQAVRGPVATVALLDALAGAPLPPERGAGARSARAARRPVRGDARRGRPARRQSSCIIWSGG